MLGDACRPRFSRRGKHLRMASDKVTASGQESVSRPGLSAARWRSGGSPRRRRRSAALRSAGRTTAGRRRTRRRVDRGSRSSPISMPSRPMRAGHRVVRPRLHLEPDRQLDEPGPHHPHISVPDRSSYARSDDEHTGRAIVIISDPAHIYQGSLDHSFGPCIGGIPPRTDPPAPEPASQVTVLITASEVTIVLAALDIAADCADCTGQTCPACESRLRDAQAYDHLSAQLIQAAQAPSAATARHSGPGPGRRPGGRSVTLTWLQAPITCSSWPPATGSKTGSWTARSAAVA